MATTNKSLLDYDGLVLYNNLVSQEISQNPKRIYFGTCSSTASSQNKIIEIPNDQAFSLVAGVVIGVKFANTNTYEATAVAPCTLNVNSSGAKSVYYNNGVPTGSNPSVFGSAGRYTFYVYDGTYWVWQSSGYESSGGGSLPSISGNTLVFS